MEKPVSNFVYWTPRIMAILATLFLALMSLDVFSENLVGWQNFSALFMHNLPTLGILIIVIIAWKYELVGGIGFILAGIIYIILVFRNPFEWYYFTWAIQISGAAFFVGILFLIGWYKKRKSYGTLTGNKGSGITK